jgi:hypothetical protein
MVCVFVLRAFTNLILPGIFLLFIIEIQGLSWQPATCSGNVDLDKNKWAYGRIGIETLMLQGDMGTPSMGYMDKQQNFFFFFFNLAQYLHLSILKALGVLYPKLRRSTLPRIESRHVNLPI